MEHAPLTDRDVLWCADGRIPTFPVLMVVGSSALRIEAIRSRQDARYGSLLHNCRRWRWPVGARPWAKRQRQQPSKLVFAKREADAK
jgi:hypothetical protein